MMADVLWPTHWRAVPLWAMFDRVKDVGHPDEEMLSVYRDHGVVRKQDRADNFNKTAPNRDIYQLVDPGWLVVNRMKAWQGSLGVSSHRGIVSGHYLCFRPTHAEDPRFIHYTLRSAPYTAEFYKRSRGVRPNQIEIDNDELRVLKVGLPKPEQQRRIVTFLDGETARIDALIAAKMRLMQIINDRFRSCLSKVLDAGPAVPARRVLKLCTSGPRGWADLLGPTGVPFIRSQNLDRASTELDLTQLARLEPPSTPEAARSRTEVGDVLVGITGANTGWVGVVAGPAEGGFVSQHVALLRPTIKVLPQWLAYSIFSHQGQAQLLGGQYGGTKQQLSLEDLGEFVLRLPELTRQRDACERLRRDEQTGHASIAVLTRQVQLLRERRQALITAAVTGEIEV